MLKLDRHILLHFLFGIFPVMLLLLSLFSFMELADTLKSVGEGGFDLWDAFSVVVLTLPKRFTDLLPVATLLGSLMGLGTLANNRELMIIRTVGFSKRHIARAVFQGALALAGLMLALQLFVIPAAENKAARINSKSLEQTNVGTKKTLEFWARRKDYFVRVRKVKFNRSLSDVEIYRLNASGRLTQMFVARHADIIGTNTWRLTGILQRDFDDDGVRKETKASMVWPNLLSGKQAASLTLPIQALTPIDLFRYIEYLNQNQMDSIQYRMVFWQQISTPLILLALALLPVPFLLGPMRQTTNSQRMMIGGILGVGFYLFQQIAANLAGLVGLNPPLIMLSPAILLLAVAAYKIFKQ